MVLTHLFLSHQAASAQLCSESGTPCIISCDETHSCYAMDINVSFSTSVFFNCSGDYSCQHLNVMAYDIDADLDEHTDITIVCQGAQSCMFATFEIPETYSLSLNCQHPDSCIDTSVALSSSNSELQINLLDSCSTFLSIRCLDEASQCSVYCDDKCVRIAADAFRVTTLTGADACFEQQFTHSCPADVEPTRATCPKS